MRQKQYDALKKLALPPADWCAILGIRMVDPDGWRRDEKPYGEPVGLDEFVRRCWPSTLGFEENSTDLSDVEGYLATDAYGQKA